MIYLILLGISDSFPDYLKAEVEAYPQKSWLGSSNKKCMCTFKKPVVLNFSLIAVHPERVLSIAVISYHLCPPVFPDVQCEPGFSPAGRPHCVSLLVPMNS